MWPFKLVCLLVLIKVLLWVYQTVKKIFLLKPINFAETYGRNTWAVVTGGSEGIGFGIAKRLASEGFNIVLIARNQQKLEKAKEEILRVNQLTDVLMISMDFAKSDKAAFFEEVETKLEGLDISILVNNVGMVQLKLLFDQEPKELRDTTVVNCCSQVGMTKLLVPKLMARSRRSAVIDLSSIAAYEPHLVFPSYHATKAFNGYLSEGLGTYVPNVDYLTVYPGMVSTPMILDRPAGSGSNLLLTVVSVEDSVRGIIDALGNISNTNGAFRHNSLYSIVPYIVSLIPKDLVPFLIKNDKRSNTLEAWKSY